jgi:two-component system, OmpR family, copper resistance phosphate regulon response regulator CusR
MRVLVVEDERKVAHALRDGLSAQGYEVVVAHDGEQGLQQIGSGAFDLMVLDLMLPRRDGHEVLASMRQRGLATPVLVLTARDSIEDRVIGLDNGADDYLVKPFAFPELLARMRALLRRGGPSAPIRLVLGDLQLDVMSRKATRSDQSLQLTVREFELLEYLLRHQGQVVSREMLAQDVWQTPMRVTPIDNVIDVHIARLRRKVDDPFPRQLIHTVRGMGFVAKEESP